MKTKFRSNLTAVILFLCMFFLIVLLPSSTYAQGSTNDIQYRQITLENYIDKVEGGWLGQAIAVLWGQWTEGKWQGEMIPFDLEEIGRAHV